MSTNTSRNHFHHSESNDVFDIQNDEVDGLHMMACPQDTSPLVNNHHTLHASSTPLSLLKTIAPALPAKLK